MWTAILAALTAQQSAPPPEDNGTVPMWDVAGAIFVHTADPTYEWEGKARLIHS